MSELNEINTHIEELRKRVDRSIISILVITVFILTFHATPFDVMGVTLYYPYPEPLDNIAAQFTNVMRGELVPEGVQLIQTAPGQAFFSQVYIAALIGIVLSIPIIVREFISFLLIKGQTFDSIISPCMSSVFVVAPNWMIPV